jgi:hypothetical protein
MPVTYENLATTTLGSETSSITFSSISAAYTDLRLVFVGVRAAGTNSAPIVRFNSDSATNYSMTAVQGTGSSFIAYKENNATGVPLVYFDALVSTTIPKLGTLDVFSYRSSAFKTVMNVEASDRSGSGRVANAVGLWRSTSAITSLTITDGSARNFGVGTTATLYGILRA